MALPLLAGMAVGSLAVLAFNNKKEIKEKVTSYATQAKEFAKESKESVQEKLDCIKSKDKKEVAK